MKNPAAYYLLLLYIVALCRPAVPLVQDIVAHTFFEHQHLATVHQHGGENHVTNELGKITGEEQAGDKPATAKMYEEVPLHLTTSLAYNIEFQDKIIVSYHGSYTVHFPTTVTAIQLPPPRG